MASNCGMGTGCGAMEMAIPVARAFPACATRGQLQSGRPQTPAAFHRRSTPASRLGCGRAIDEQEAVQCGKRQQSKEQAQLDQCGMAVAGAEQSRKAAD